ncbi:MAG: glycosyltransferase [Nocardioidaceae bacterium]
MPANDLPTGRYLSCPIDLSPDAGGQTRALLLRNRIFVKEAGLTPSVLSFNARTDLDERRAVMLERGLLLDEIATPNIYQHYRDHGWGRTVGDVETQPLRDLTAHTISEETFPDGSPWRTVYKRPGSRFAVFDYLRPDGSPFLRIPHFVFKEPETWPTSLQQIDGSGKIIGTFGSLGQWFRSWIRELTAKERSFVFVDSRFNAQHVAPMRASHIHIIYVLHNIHVSAPHLWSSETTEMYRRVLARIGGMDAMVTLTERQRDDIALRRGRTTNLFVVSNPVDMPEPVERRQRDPNLVAIVARLEKQKRLTDAIRAFALVRKEIPTARLDIYGDGSQRTPLQQEVDRLHLGEAVTLRGHDPHARDALWTASAFLVTSVFEGWNLAMQESMTRGCPVVSYDVKYGPREQITDGVDGFLVPDRDIPAVAERVVRLLSSPELVEKMGSAATGTTARHGSAHFVGRWRQVLESVVDLKPYRTNLAEVALDVTNLRVVRSSRQQQLRSPADAFAPTLAGEQDNLHLEATLRVRGQSPRADLDSATVSLASVHHPSGTLVDLPLSVVRDGSQFALNSRFPLVEAMTGAPPGADMRLMLRLVWQNSSWQAFIERPLGTVEGVEVTYEDGEGEGEVLRLRSR